MTWGCLDNCIFVDCSDSISAGDPSDDIAGDVVGEIEDDAIFGMRLILIYDSFGIIKSGKRPEWDRGLGVDVNFIALKDDRLG